MYKVEWKDEALKSLVEIGSIGKKIKIKVETHLVENPTKLGEPLKGDDFKGLWRYCCFKKYRVIYQILETKLIITVVEVGLRKDIYQKLSRKF